MRFVHLWTFLVLFAAIVTADRTAATTQYIYQTDGTEAARDALMRFADSHRYTVEPLYSELPSPYYVVTTPAARAAPAAAKAAVASGKLTPSAHLTPLHVFAAANGHVLHAPLRRRVDAMVRYANPYAIPHVDVARNFYVPSARNRNEHLNLHADNVTQTGAGVRVYIPDGGMQCDHAAFAASGGFGKPSCDASLAGSFSTCSDNRGTAPEGPTDVHATMCASVVCARQYGGGIAPGATCVPRRYICAGEWTLVAEARANAVAEMAILSVSNGPPDGVFYYEVPPPPLVHGMVETWNRGTVRFDAAGNGGIRGETCAADWTVSLQQTLGVGAITASGLPEQYSEACPGVLLSAFGASGSNVIYTALADPASRTAMSDLFDGTSAAAPQVAGVAALLREARPDIWPRDIVRALVATARRDGLVGTTAPFVVNSAGFAHSAAFGFGYPDAAALIAYATSANWSALPAQRTCEGAVLGVTANAADPMSNFDIVIPPHCEINFIEHVAIHVSFGFEDASYMGELALSSPSGRRATFLDSFHGYHIPRWDFYSGGWPWYGERAAAGTWTLSVEALDDFPIAAASIVISGAVMV